MTHKSARWCGLVAIFPVCIGGAVLAVHVIIRRLERSIDSLNDVSAALRRSETQFRELFDNVPDGVFRVSPDGRLLMANPACARMLGFAAPDAMRDLDVRGMYEEPGVRDSLLRALEMTGEVRNMEARFRAPDGRIITALVSGRVVRDEDGRPRHTEGTLVDITERKQLEEQLQQAQKMEAVGRLAGGIAHDFNNLQTAILGSVHLMRDREPVSERHEKDLVAIETAAHSASHLTGQLIDLNAVVTRARTLLRRVIGKDIALIARLALDPLPVVVDASQIEQVIMNLGINARDAMPHGGRLAIETFTADPADGDIGLAVTDTGTGIDDNTLARIFEPFFTTKDFGRGTGLGLATVYGIVQQTGGRIEVESEPERGTRVLIKFPRATLPITPARAGRSQPKARGAETILLVEDESAVRDVTREILQHAGYTVLEAASGAEAVEVVVNGGANIDLVLTDVVMPAMSGPALAERLHGRAIDVPLLFMSGYAGDMLDPQGDAASERPFLAKPFTADHLLTKVRGVLDSGS